MNHQHRGQVSLGAYRFTMYVMYKLQGDYITLHVCLHSPEGAKTGLVRGL